jgi:hypothetical protein
MVSETLLIVRDLSNNHASHTTTIQPGSISDLVGKPTVTIDGKQHTRQQVLQKIRETLSRDQSSESA